MDDFIFVKITDIPFKLRLIRPELMVRYEEYAAQACPEAVDISANEAEIMKSNASNPLSAELFRHALNVGDVLPEYNRLLFHGCAFEWRGKAWIFTGPSGTGKSTQYIQWKLLYGNEIHAINGDKPILELRDDCIMVHSSPWRGKEHMGVVPCAPLGGIIDLNRSEENSIERITPQEAAETMFNQILFTAPNEECIKKAAALEEKILESVCVWRLNNRGDGASAKLCHDTIKGEFYGEKI